MDNFLLTEAEIQDLILPYALKVAKDVSSYSESAINAFYSHYTPLYYKRVGGLNHIWEANINPISKGLQVEIRYSSGLVSGHHDSNEGVFAGSFIGGYHGTQEYFKGKVPQMSPSPSELIDKYVSNYSL